MSNVVHSFDFLDRGGPPVGSFVVLFGDETFLHRLVLQSLRKTILGEGDVPFADLAGKTAEWCDVADELSTVSLFSSGPRLVIIGEGDEFVTRYRSELEDRAENASAHGTLILSVNKLATNTRLYKRVAEHSLAIDCRLPQRGGRSKAVDTTRVKKWIVAWAKDSHGFKLQADAAETMLDLTGQELGLIDQNLAKLSLYVEKGETATADLVRDVVAGWRLQTIWDIVDKAAEGDAKSAMTHLDAVLRAGDAPQAIFGQLAWSIRRYAKACRLIEQMEKEGRRPNENEAIQASALGKGPPGTADRARTRLRQIGRKRAGHLHQWLLEIDLALKGSHSRPERGRLMLEQLIVRLSKEARPL